MARKILVAEDERPIANVLSLKLKKSGFDVKAVFDGEQALASLEEEDFDMMLLDLVMPKVDGFEVLKRLKEKGKKLPVIVLSNLGQEEDIKRAREAGAREYFVKSNTPLTEVALKVKKVFEEEGS
ncbi:response regulator [Candidatus Dojkabacteria bacterium]|nr:response regulator [Candidatus Dojkabacteria bacterium]